MLIAIQLVVLHAEVVAVGVVVVGSGVVLVVVGSGVVLLVLVEVVGSNVVLGVVVSSVVVVKQGPPGHSAKQSMPGFNGVAGSPCVVSPLTA